MRPATLRVLIASLVIALAPGVACAQAQSSATVQPPSLSARNAVLMDYENGSFLYERAADVPVSPASLTKLMTAELVFKALKEGKLNFDQEVLITADIWRRGGAPSGGSTMFAAVNSKIRVEDLIQGLIVVSGNDAAMALADAVGGDQEQFAKMMTERAHELGLQSANFVNSTGLDDPNHKISVRDLATLTAHLIRTYPEYFHYYGQRDFTWNKITQKNRNPLLDMDIGADGMKTGYTKDAGYSLVGTAVQNGIRLIVVVSGSPSLKERGEDARRLLDWGFKNFEPLPLVKQGEVVAEAQVFGGDMRHVPLVTEKELRVFTQHGASNHLFMRAVYTGPLRAPIAKGTQVARLKAWRGQRLVLDAPLYTAVDVHEGGLVRKAMDGAYELAVDLLRHALSKLKHG
jgi:D-alanyl-D-alanine carboxypeptidase (penicillin-binding protein 5/6)